MPYVPALPKEERDPYLIRMHNAANQLNILLQQSANVRCEFFIMDEEHIASFVYPELVRCSRGNRLFVGDWYMILTAPNGHNYYVNVTADSVLTACADTLNFASTKF